MEEGDPRRRMESYLGGPVPDGALVRSTLLIPSEEVAEALDDALRAGLKAEAGALEESCRAWRDRLKGHYAAGGAGAAPEYSAALRRPLLEAISGPRRRFRVRVRVA